MLRLVFSSSLVKSFTVLSKLPLSRVGGRIPPAFWKDFFCSMGKRVSPKGEFYGRDLNVSRSRNSYFRNLDNGNGDVMNPRDEAVHKTVNKAVCVVDKDNSTSYEITLPRQVLKLTVEVVDRESDAKAPF